MAARTFVETGANKVAIIDLNEEDSKRAATEMVDWFGTSPARHPTSSLEVLLLSP